VQWPCNDAAPEGMPIMHIDGFARGKGKFVITEYIPTEERSGPRFPLLLTTGPRALANITSARRRAGPKTASGIPRTCWRSIAGRGMRGVREG